MQCGERLVLHTLRLKYPLRFKLANAAKRSDDISTSYLRVITLRVPVMHEAGDFVLGGSRLWQIEVLPDKEQEIPEVGS